MNATVFDTYQKDIRSAHQPIKYIIMVPPPPPPPIEPAQPQELEPVVQPPPPQRGHGENDVDVHELKTPKTPKKQKKPFGESQQN